MELNIEREIRVWQAVLLDAIQQWQSGPLRAQLRAEHYLFEDKVDFPVVCRAAGMDPSQLRSKLNKLRGRVNPIKLARAA